MKKIIDRIVFQKIKKYTYDQMQEFLLSIYSSGHQAATKELGDVVIDMNKEQIVKDIKEFIRKEYGIGEKRAQSHHADDAILTILENNSRKLDIVSVEVSLKDEE